MHVYVCLDRDYSKNKMIRDLRYEDLTIVGGLPIHIFLMKPIFRNGCSWFGFEVSLEPNVIEGDIFPGVSNRWFFEAYDMNQLFTLDVILKQKLIMALCDAKCDILDLSYQSYFVPYEGHWEAFDAFTRQCDAFA